MKNRSKQVLTLSVNTGKGGNKDMLCDEFIYSAQDTGHRTRKINVNRLNMKGCLDRRICQDNGDTCVPKDNMAAVCEKLLAEGVIVLTLPVYFYRFNF